MKTKTSTFYYEIETINKISGKRTYRKVKISARTNDEADQKVNNQFPKAKSIDQL